MFRRRRDKADPDVPDDPDTVPGMSTAGGVAGDRGGYGWDGGWGDGPEGDGPDDRHGDDRDRDGDDPDRDGYGRDDDRDPDAGARGSVARRPRRWVIALGLVLVLAIGFVGGMVADRFVVPPRAVPGEGTPLVGAVEGVDDGVLTVRTADGALVALRTSEATRVAREQPFGGSPTVGAPVEVLTRRDADGALTATSIGLPAR